MDKEKIISKIINILKNYKVNENFIIGYNNGGYSVIKTGITRKNMQEQNLTLSDIEEIIKEKINIDSLLFHYSMYYDGVSENDEIIITINNMMVNTAMLYKYIEVMTKKLLCENKQEMFQDIKQTFQIPFFYEFSGEANDEEIKLIIEHNIEEVFRFIDYKSKIDIEVIYGDDFHKGYCITMNIELTYTTDNKTFLLSIIKNYLYFIFRPEVVYTYYKVIIPISGELLKSFCITENELWKIIKEITYVDAEYRIYINDSGLLEIETSYVKTLNGNDKN